MDEAGANLQGLRKVYGDEFMERVVSCQFHFKQCARRQLKNIDENDQATFMHLVMKICLAQTVAEYKKYADALEHICVKKQMHTLVQLVESTKVPLGACSTGVRLDREQLG